MNDGEEDLAGLEKAIGYHFRDPDLLRQALTHRSNSQRNNERLEFLGDSILSYVVAEFLYADEEDDDEDALTKKRSKLTDRVALEVVGKRIGLLDHIIVGKSMKGKASGKMISDAVEALIGAVYQDGGDEGMKHASDLVHRLLLNNEIMEQVLGRIDWITRVKEWCDGQRRPQPKYYVLVERLGPKEENVFHVWLKIDEHSGSGYGSTKKEAMMIASEKIMRSLESAGRA